MIIHPHDPNLVSAAMAGRSAASRDAANVDNPTIDSAFRLLVIRGMSGIEAGNLVAYMTGLHPAEGGWTVAEIRHLVAIRSLVAAGYIES